MMKARRIPVAAPERLKPGARVVVPREDGGGFDVLLITGTLDTGLTREQAEALASGRVN